MKIIKTDFDILYEELNILNEAKQDTLNFIKFFTEAGYTQIAAEDLVARFDKLKRILKTPENDYYY
jgi:hypothetical protein